MKIVFKWSVELPWWWAKMDDNSLGDDEVEEDKRYSLCDQLILINLFSCISREIIENNGN